MKDQYSIRSYIVNSNKIFMISLLFIFSLFNYSCQENKLNEKQDKGKIIKNDSAKLKGNEINSSSIDSLLENQDIHKINPLNSLYTRQKGYGTEDVVWWNGRRVGGVSIGVIQLVANIPMIPGNVGNASTFDFPLMYEPMDVTGDMVVSKEPHPEVIKRAIIAAKKLQEQGCRAIVGNCGFFANYQQYVTDELDIPFFGSSLLQIPNILITIRSNQKVLVLTANGPILEEAPALENSGVTDRSRLVIVGAETKSEMQNILQTKGYYNPKKFESQLVDLAKEAVKNDPTIGAVLLECTELSPHAFAIQQELGLPVWDFTTMINWIESGLVRSPFEGNM